MPRALRIGVYKIPHKMIKAYDMETLLLGNCPINREFADGLWTCAYDSQGFKPCRRWSDKTHGCAGRFIYHYFVMPDAERG